MLFRLKEEISAFMKDRDRIQYKLEKNVIFQQYLEKVLEAAEEVFRHTFICYYYYYNYYNNNNNYYYYYYYYCYYYHHYHYLIFRFFFCISYYVPGCTGMRIPLFLQI